MKIKFYIVLLSSFLFFKFNYGFPIDMSMKQSLEKKKNLVYTVLFTKLNIQDTNLLLFLDVVCDGCTMSKCTQWSFHG